MYLWCYVPFVVSPHHSARRRVQNCVDTAAGITMDESLDRFMDSDTGKEFMLRQSKLLPLEKGKALLVPAGFCMYLFAYEHIERSQSNSLAHLCYLPLGGPFVRNDVLTSREKHCIMTANHAAMGDKALTSNMWSGRKAYFETLFKPV